MSFAFSGLFQVRNCVQSFSCLFLSLVWAFQGLGITKKIQLAMLELQVQNGYDHYHSFNHLSFDILFLGSSYT